MYAQIENKKESNNTAITNPVTQKKNNSREGFGFIDARPETIMQRKLQEMTNNRTTNFAEPKICNDNHIKNKTNIRSPANVAQLGRNAEREKLKLARKKAKIKQQQDQALVHTTRVASGGGVTAKSAGGAPPAHDQKATTMWNQMIANNNAQQIETWSLDNCAESQLWMNLVEKGRKPKDIDVVVKKFSQKGKSKSDPPCRNCKQWAYTEFKSIN